MSQAGAMLPMLVLFTEARAALGNRRLSSTSDPSIGSRLNAHLRLPSHGMKTYQSNES